MPKMTPEQLQSLIAGRLKTEIGNSELSQKRRELLQRYHGELYGDEVKGLSQVVDTSTRDVVEWIKPELVEMFLGGEKIVRFDPVGPEDVDACERETRIVNHVALERNEGFLWVYSWIHDALTQGVGYVKITWESREYDRRDKYANLDEMRLTQLMTELEEDNESVEVVEQEERTEVMLDPMSGAELEVTLTDMTVRVRGRDAGFPRIVPLPPEEVIIPQDHNSILLTDVPSAFHKFRKPRSELIAMGFSRESVEAMSAEDRSSADSLGSERDARLDAGHVGGSQGAGMQLSGADEDQGAMTIVGGAEGWIRADWNGDGVAEILHVFTGLDGKILEWSDEMKDRVESVQWPLAVEEAPFVGLEAITPIISTHRHQGVSVAELVIQLQRILTSLTRQMLDNLAKINNGLTVIDEHGCSDNTQVDHANSGVPGGALRWDSSMGGQQPFLLAPPDMVSQSLAAIDYFKTMREENSVSRLQQGLDADALNKTATGQAQLMDAGVKKIKLMARVMAETGFKSLMHKVHAMLRLYGGEKLSLQIGGQWVEDSPSEWRERRDMTATVGLGTGDVDREYALLADTQNRQVQLLAPMGLAGPKEIHHTQTQMLLLQGKRDAGNYVIDPASEGFVDPRTAAPPADPMVQIKQIEAETSRLKMELERQRLEVEAVQKAEEYQLAWAKLEFEKQKAAAELGLKASDQQVKRDLAEGGAVVQFAKMDVDRAKHQEARADAFHGRQEQRFDGERTRQEQRFDAERSAEREREERAKDRKLKTGPLARKAD